MNNKKRFVVIAIFAVMALVISGASGCEKKIAEKITEKAIEGASNSGVDVDLDNDQITINTNSGSFQAGENVTLPDNFPSDVYVIDGDIQSAITSAENGSFSVSIESSDSVSEVQAKYTQQMADEGWTSSLTMNYGDSASLGFTKGETRTATIIIAANNDTNKTTVSITTSTNEDFN